MNYTINTIDYQHLGFLVLIAENEQEPTFGSGLIKLQSEDDSLLQSREAQNLSLLTQPFTWDIENDTMTFHHENDIKSQLQGEYLTVGAIHYRIHDLTGNI